MTRIDSSRVASPTLALSLACLILLILVAAYSHLYVGSTQKLRQVRGTHERLAWISSVEPKWRAEVDALRRSLESDPPFVHAAQPQNAAAEMQSQIRQALMATGATIESLQSTVVTTASGQLPAIRAVVIARTAPDRIMEVVRSLEAIDPPLGVESLDIVTQQLGGKESLQRVAILTIAVRTYVLGDGNGAE